MRTVTRSRALSRALAGCGLEPAALGWLAPHARTGAEMEALYAVTVATPIVYDVVKVPDKAMTVGKTRLVRRAGGRTGEHRRR